MPRPNDEVAALLGEYAELISITGGDAFKARVYSRAARAIRGYSADVSQLGPGELRQIPGVGKSIADKVAEYLSTGSIRVVEELRAGIPAGRPGDDRDPRPRAEPRPAASRRAGDRVGGASSPRPSGRAGCAT